MNVTDAGTGSLLIIVRVRNYFVQSQSLVQPANGDNILSPMQLEAVKQLEQFIRVDFAVNASAFDGRQVQLHDFLYKGYDLNEQQRVLIVS